MYLYRLVMIISVQIFYNIYLSDACFWFRVVKHNVEMRSVVLFFSSSSFGSNVCMRQNRNTLTPHEEVRCSFKSAAKTLQPQQCHSIHCAGYDHVKCFPDFAAWSSELLSSRKAGARTHKPDSVADREIWIFISQFSWVFSFSYNLLLPFQNLASFCRSTPSFKANKTLIHLLQPLFLSSDLCE